jgi:predicted HicB family RNase H-like nuclease
MAKKATEKKTGKAEGKVMAVRAPISLHRAAASAAKTAGESLGRLMLRGIALAIAEKKVSKKE